MVISLGPRHHGFRDQSLFRHRQKESQLSYPRHSRVGGNPGSPCVYLLANRRNGTLYAGVTSNLPQRVWQHKEDLAEGFTRRHGVHTLVWYEVHETMESAIVREKALKGWNRSWKLRMIEEGNLEWRDLYEELGS
jgi:putative endonuclease